MVDRLNLVPRLNPGLAIQVITTTCSSSTGSTLSRLNGTHSQVLRGADGLRSVRAIAEAAAATAQQAEVSRRSTR